MVDGQPLAGGSWGRPVLAGALTLGHWGAAALAAGLLALLLVAPVAGPACYPSARLLSPRPTPVVSTTTTGTAGLTSRAIEDLFAENVTRINAMNTAAGSPVKALLMELERRRTFLKLRDPAPGAHTARSSVVQGDRHSTCAEST